MLGRFSLPSNSLLRKRGQQIGLNFCLDSSILYLNSTHARTSSVGSLLRTNFRSMRDCRWLNGMTLSLGGLVCRRSVAGVLVSQAQRRGSCVSGEVLAASAMRLWSLIRLSPAFTCKGNCCAYKGSSFHGKALSVGRCPHEAIVKSFQAFGGNLIAFGKSRRTELWRSPSSRWLLGDPYETLVSCNQPLFPVSMCRCCSCV